MKKVINRKSKRKALPPVVVHVGNGNPDCPMCQLALAEAKARKP